MYPKRDIYCLCWSLNQGPLAYQSSHSTELTEESTHYPEPGKESNVLQEIPDQKQSNFPHFSLHTCRSDQEWLKNAQFLYMQCQPLVLPKLWIHHN